MNLCQYSGLTPSCNKSDPSGNDAVDGILSVLDFIGSINATVSVPAVGSVAGTGGVDVTKPLKRTLLNVQAAFWGWTRYQKLEAARQMRDIWGAAAAKIGNRVGLSRSSVRSGAYNDWDIIPLMEVGFGLHDGYLMADNKGYRTGTGLWKNTVSFNGKCYYGTAVNYALWGTMNHCIYEWQQQDPLPPQELDRTEYTLGNAIHTMRAFKHFEYSDFGYAEKESEEFTAYGYNGTMPSSALPCHPNGEVVQAKSFDWCWEPVVHRP